MPRSKQPSANRGRFVGKVAAVTGSARGIGKNTCRAFGREGAQVVICDIDEESGRATEAELLEEGISVEFLCVDLICKGAPQAMVKQIVQQWGRLDVLVNNAKSGQRANLLEEDEDSWDLGMSVTLKAAFFASQEAIPAMGRVGGGSIVNVSSVLGMLSGPHSPSYHAAKAALVQMTRYLAVEAGGYGTRVNCVMPGFIVQDEHGPRYERDDNRRYREIVEFAHPLGFRGKSDDIANAVLFLSSPEAAFINGETLVVDGGLTLQEQSGLLFRFETAAT